MSTETPDDWLTEAEIDAWMLADGALRESEVDWLLERREIHAAKLARRRAAYAARKAAERATA